MLSDRCRASANRPTRPRAVLQAMDCQPGNHPVLDIGGDKQLLHLQETQRITRGQRGIRFLLDHPDVLTQLRRQRKMKGWVIYDFSYR